MLTEAALLNGLKDKDFLYFGTAQQKYQEFCRRYPDLVLRVPQHYIPRTCASRRNRSAASAKVSAAE